MFTSLSQTILSHSVGYLMKNWEITYKNGLHRNNVDFPEQFLIKMLSDAQRKNRFDHLKNPSILDIGCGYGRNMALYLKYSNNITCIDPVEDAVSFVNGCYPGTAHVFHPPNFLINKTYDLVIACNSIYYLDLSFNFFDYFRNIIKLMSKGGIFIFSLVGKEHSILLGGHYLQNEVFSLNNEHENFSSRVGQLIFLPDEAINFNFFGLSLFSKGEVRDVFDGLVRHLHVYMVEKLHD